MNIIKQDFKKGLVKIRIENLDDLWYLSHLIDQSDLIEGTTTRKIKIGDGENAKTVKKKVTLKIQVEKTEYIPENEVLRINGKIIDGPEDFPRGSYQNISLENESEFTIEKTKWLTYQINKLKEASKKTYQYLLCLFDREEVLFALSKPVGFQVLSRFNSDLPKKGDITSSGGSYYQEIIKTLESYQKRIKPEHIILASPAFYKEDLYKLIKNQDLKKGITTTICSSAKRPSLYEVMRRPELKDVLTQSRSRVENLLVEELLAEIGKDQNFAYGFQEVSDAINSGAVAKLIVTDKYIHKKREDGTYQEIDQLLTLVDNLNGEVHIISGNNDPGKKVDGLGGISAITRYKL